MAGVRFKRRNLSLDDQTMETLRKISDENGYETISRTIRVLVKKYGKFELEETEHDENNKVRRNDAGNMPTMVH